MAISAQNLIDMARQRADFVSSTYLTDSTELLTWCRESYKELADLLTEAYGSEYLTLRAGFDVLPSVFTPLSGLSVPLLKLVRLERYFSLRSRPFGTLDIGQDTLDLNGVTWDESTDLRCQLVGAQMAVQPVPLVTEACVIWYVPQIVMTALSDTIAVAAEPWAEYIVIDLAIKMRVKEESDAAPLMLAKEAMRQRVITAAQPRDQGRPTRAVDIRGRDEGVDDWDVWP